MNLGKKIKLARVARGWSQEELAEKVNKTRALISHIENTGKVNSYTLNYICKVLNLDVSTLMENSSISPSDFFFSEKNSKKEIKILLEKIKLLEGLVESQKELIASLKGRLMRPQGK